MTRKDGIGFEVSGASARAIERLEQAAHELRCLVGDPVATVREALDDSPEMVMGHVLNAYLHLLATEPAGLSVARDSLNTARDLPATDRERRHVDAVARLSAGRWRDAGRALEDLSIEYPRDSLALQVGHQVDFFTGDSRMLRDRIARAIPHWSPSMPGYHAVLGMHAFGLEETGDYRRAEAAGRRCVELEPRDGWGQHAVAHVMEMEGRCREGIDWMRAAPQAWADGSFFSVHNWWHTALFHLGLDQVDEVLALYDGPVKGGESGLALDMIDASALLWRLHLRGVDVGARWDALADRWSAIAGTRNYAFNDLHAVISFVGAGRADAASDVVATQVDAMQRGDDNAAFTREVGHAATRAIVAFGDGDHEKAVDLLRSVRNSAHRFGGSHAQRDLLDLTLIEAASRGGRTALAEALRVERAAAKPVA
jgi:hypothetical protein